MGHAGLRRDPRHRERQGHRGDHPEAQGGPRGGLVPSHDRLTAGPPGGLRAPRPRSGTPAAVLALEEAAALAWPAPETRRLGGWLLRAGGGWTGRANSALPLGPPGPPIDEALAAVAAWYAARGLPPRSALPLPGAEALDEQLAARGWTARDHTEVLAADLAAAPPAAPGGAGRPPVQLRDAPSGQWIAAYRARAGGGLPPQARAILAGTAPVAFAEVRLGGAVAAIARVSVDRGWAGLSAVEVGSAHRRRGLGRHVAAAALAWGAAHGADRAYAQVLADNAPALALFAGMSFTAHHRYRYRVAPAT
jgi:ribosomal protein S18 acetylase RimI-like enzyme